jgi:hypothetical protein
MKALQQVSVLHGLGHLVTVLSMGLGSVRYLGSFFCFFGFFFV